MTNQEREQLVHLLQQMTQAQAGQKDNEADSLIREACMRQPDAAYLLALRVMLMDHALQNSQAQIAQLQLELGQVRHQATNVSGGGTFLDANAWGNSAQTRPNAAPPPVPPYQTTPASLTPSSPAPVASSWGGTSMLGNIATTAAGVVAGGFLFQGIGHLLGAHNSNSGLMNGLSGNASVEHHEQPVIDPPVDDSVARDGLFDTSSVDNYIASPDSEASI